MLDRLNETGGRGVWSDAIYRLESYLERSHRDASVVTTDWGLAGQLVALSQGELRVQEAAFDLRDAPKPGNVLSASLQEPDASYVLHTSGATVFPGVRERFFSGLRMMRRRPTLLRRFRERQGTPIIEVYAVKGSDGPEPRR
jgi:hypothetical protein